MKDRSRFAPVLSKVDPEFMQAISVKWRRHRGTSCIIQPLAGPGLMQGCVICSAAHVGMSNLVYTGCKWRHRGTSCIIQPLTGPGLMQGCLICSAAHVGMSNLVYTGCGDDIAVLAALFSHSLVLGSCRGV